jgi:hypothetical protein
MVASGMKKVFSQVSILLLFCTMISCQTQDTQKAGSYQASWESLTKHETPVWFRDAKFGIYFHWGHIRFQLTKRNGILITCMIKITPSINIMWRNMGR